MNYTPYPTISSRRFDLNLQRIPQVLKTDLGNNDSIFAVLRRDCRNAVVHLSHPIPDRYLRSEHCVLERLSKLIPQWVWEWPARVERCLTLPVQ